MYVSEESLENTKLQMQTHMGVFCWPTAQPKCHPWVVLPLVTLEDDEHISI